MSTKYHHNFIHGVCVGVRHTINCLPVVIKQPLSLCVCVCAGVYKLVASGPSGTAEKELQLIVVPEGGGEEETDAEVDLTPIPVDGFGAYVAEQHANGNKKFANNYSVGLIHISILPAS